MKFGAKNLELVLVSSLIIVTVIAFLLLAGGLASDATLSTLQPILLLMIFAGQTIETIVLLRMYDLIAMGNQTKKR